MKQVYDYIEAHLQEALADLARLCRQPSVSAQGLGVEECARLTTAMLRESGLEARLLPVPGGYPVVYGEIGDAPTTLLFYNHYDVQPPEPLELWSSPPFEPTLKDEKLLGRGVSDNKGNIVARLLAVKAFREVRGRLPIRVKFCIEGEEEIGSRNLPAFVQEHRDLLKANACLWEGGGVNWKGQPTITLGVKGILYVELEARTAARDLHSSWGTVIPNAAWRLVWALNSLKDAQENILIPGFYEHVRPPTPREVKAVRAMPREDRELGESLGLDHFLKDLSGPGLQERHLLEPTCTICGLLSGYTGEGSKTVLPCLARAKVDFRLVPNQRPEDIIAKLRRHLDEQGFSDIAITTPMEGENPARTPLDHPLVKLVVEAAREVYGLEPVVSPTMSGTGPMFPFTETLGLPVASAGVEYPDCRIHAPDENIRVQDFLRGAQHIAAIMEHLGRGRP